MNGKHLTALVAASALFTAPAMAQPAVGSEAPEFEVQGAYNDAPASFAEFRGKLVMIEFFATW
ncbi:MAG: hypothetical protein AAF196_19270 [Planctomycetota bacterium]